MTYGACLKPKYMNKLNLNQQQRADVFMNSLIVHVLQLSMIFLIWDFALST